MSKKDLILDLISAIIIIIAMIIFYNIAGQWCGTPPKNHLMKWEKYWKLLISTMFQKKLALATSRLKKSLMKKQNTLKYALQLYIIYSCILVVILNNGRGSL